MDRPTEAPAWSQPEPWGFWATAVLSLLVVVAWGAAQFVAALLAQAIGGESVPFDSGLVIAVATLASLPAGVGTIWFLARGRGDPRRYLALVGARWKPAAGWVAVFALYVAATEAVKVATGLPRIPESMVHAYRTAGSPLLLGLSLVVAAPLFEEVFLRGFVFRGVAASRLGPWGAVILTSIVWAALHVQYPGSEMALIAPAGVLLALARWRTGSLVPPLLMHAGANLFAVIQLATGAY